MIMCMIITIISSCTMGRCCGVCDAADRRDDWARTGLSVVDPSGR
jgi:hypothetical protein